MPYGDRTGRLGRGKDCDETARADRIGGQQNPPRDGRGEGRGWFGGRGQGQGQGRGRGRRRW